MGGMCAVCRLCGAARSVRLPKGRVCDRSARVSAAAQYHAEIAFSCPRLRPIINNDRSIRRTYTAQLLGGLRLPHLHAVRVHHHLNP